MPALADGKTGPGTAPLNSHTRGILERRPRDGSPYAFPSPIDPTRPRDSEPSLWYRARQDAGIEDVRLHDLRHTFASHAVMNGVPLPVVSRLLGHSSVRTTLRHAHLADRDVEVAAERIGRYMAIIVDLSRKSQPRSGSRCNRNRNRLRSPPDGLRPILFATVGEKTQNCKIIADSAIQYGGSGFNVQETAVERVDTPVVQGQDGKYLCTASDRTSCNDIDELPDG